MDVNTGRLVALNEAEAEAIEKQEFNSKEMEKKLKDLEKVPEELNNAAKKKLAGKEEAYVSLTSGGKLSRWAASRRRANKSAAAKKKIRRKMARESKKINRKK